MERERIDVRAAEGDELPAVMNVLDAAMLETDAATVRGRLVGDTEGSVLVAVQEGRVLGACLVDTPGNEPHDAGGGPAHVEAVAVRPGRRGQGVGSALIEAAVDRWGQLTADFDERVRPFYESLGFEVGRVSDGDEGGQEGGRSDADSGGGPADGSSGDERFRGRRG